VAKSQDGIRVVIYDQEYNIADEYHQLKSKHEATAKHLDQKVEQFSQRLNQLLVELDPPGSRIADSSFRIQDSGAGN